jgi:hypothetical protein
VGAGDSGIEFADSVGLEPTMNPNDRDQSDRNPRQGNEEPISGPDRGSEERHGQLNRDRDRADDRGRPGRGNGSSDEEAIPELDDVDGDTTADQPGDDPLVAGTDNKAGG